MDEELRVSRAQKLTELIKRRGVKRTFVAKQVGLSYPAFFMKLRGDREFTIIEAIKIKCILHMTDAEFMDVFGEEEIRRGYDMLYGRDGDED